MAQSLRSSRRAMLRGLGLGGLGFATTSWAQTANPLAAILPSVQSNLHAAGLADWSASVGSSFTVKGGAGSALMTLVAVKALDAPGARPSNIRPSALALVFEGAASQVPAGNQTYVFQRQDGSQIQLFVGAKFAAGSNARLVAVLN